MPTCPFQISDKTACATIQKALSFSMLICFGRYQQFCGNRFLQERWHHLCTTEPYGKVRFFLRGAHKYSAICSRGGSEGKDYALKPGNKKNLERQNLDFVVNLKL